MSEVVLAVLIIFHIFPFEGIAPATADSSGTTLHTLWGYKNLPTAFLSDSGDKIHDFAIALQSMDGWIDVNLELLVALLPYKYFAAD